MQKRVIKFWGVRGSLARPGSLTTRVGGNTPCVEIRYDKELIIIDTGTGIYNLGRTVNGKLDVAILYSHYHWDHMIGLPFFAPVYNKESKLTIIGRTGLKTALNKLFSPPNFPIRLSDFLARLRLIEKREGVFNIGNIKVETFDVNHPNGAFGFSFYFPNGKKVVHISDNGPLSDDSKLISKIKNADILIHDAQYLVSEFLKKKKFGHSTYQYVLDIARRANAKSAILFHHDPSHTDTQIYKIEKAAQKLGRKIGLKSAVCAAKEGVVIKL